MSTEDVPAQRGHHDDQTSHYPLPADAREHNRLDAQHAGVLALMHNQPIHATVDDIQIKTVIDIGCGSGIMTLHLARRFPSAKVYGIDIAAVPEHARITGRQLGNVEWLQGNIYELAGHHPALQPGSINYAFHRFLNAGMKNYRDHIRTVHSLLAPHGWCEMQDIPLLDFFDMRDNRIISTDWEWNKAIQSSAVEKGLESCWGYPAITMKLQEVDFDRVSSKLYKLPSAPVEGRPETDKYAAYAVDGHVEAFSSIFPVLFPERKEYCERLAAEVRQTLRGPKDIWFPMLVAWAQKPAEPV